MPQPIAAFTLPPTLAAISAWERLIVLLGSIGPIGYAPASGTVTVAIIGIPLFWITRRLRPTVYAAFVLVFAATGMWLHDMGNRILDARDSSRLVWDELAGFLVATAFLPFNRRIVLFAFLLERAFDGVKIPPANWIDHNLHTGFGAVADDIVAGLYTCVLLHLAARYLPRWVGLDKSPQ